jgi:phospholipid/cholesterol/gamma-HCH transport system substrate-binding protein
MTSAFVSIEDAGSEVAQVARTVNEAMTDNEGQLPRILQKTEATLDGLNATMDSLQRILGDDELGSHLEKSLRDLPDFVQEARETLATARTTFDSFQRVSDKAEVNLDNLENFTRPLGERGERLIDEVEQSTIELRRTITNIAEFSESFREGEGTLAKLIKDDDLYQKIDRLVSNAEDLSRRLKPIVEDVRIFTDKIARDPSQLGVKGALDRRPSGLKTGLSTW